MPEPVSSAARVFGERVAESRTRLGLTQEEVAHLASLNVSNYGKIERGLNNPTLHTILRLAAALNADAGTWLTGIDASHLPETRRVYSVMEFIRERDARN